MPTQVRIFTRPRSLGESLSVPNHHDHTPTPSNTAQIPRSVPINGEIPNGIPDPGLVCNETEKKMGVNEDKAYPGVTFAHQEKLPKLPIPELASSCNKYLQALKPLQSAREHSDTRHAVQEFLKQDGPELQEKLKKYAEERTSYIEQFCKSWWSTLIRYPSNPKIIHFNHIPRV